VFCSSSSNRLRVPEVGVPEPYVSAVARYVYGSSLNGGRPYWATQSTNPSRSCFTKAVTASRSG